MSNYGAYPTPAPVTYGAPMGPGDPTAVMGRRIGAYFIDAILIAVVTIALVIAGFFAFKPYKEVTGLSSYSGGASAWCSDHYNNSTSNSSSSDAASGFCFDTGSDTAYVIKGGDIGTLYGLFFGVEAICWLLDFVVLQGLTGASVGKLLVGLRVVAHDGRICGLGRALVRTVLLIVDGFCFALVGLISSFTSKGHRRVGDMAASTLVVRKEQVGHPVAVPGLTTPPQYGSPYGAPQPPYQAPSGWAQPGPSTGPAAPPQNGGEASADGPHWDEARHAYITYDRSRGAWLEYNQATGQWGPISQ